ncbi:MAG: AMP-binding protein [Candidatus Omnitrophota bacterium]|nr:AMP-binding protein [Candidatus Omnitrophota bacterium]
MKVSQILQDTAKSLSEKPAIFFKEDKITFRELAEKSNQLACGLKKLGVKKGDKIALFLPNWPEYIYSYLAVFILGAVAVPLDLMLRQEELEACLIHSEAKVLISVTSAHISLEVLQKNILSLESIILCNEKREGFLSFEEILEEPKAQINCQFEQDSPALIMYTSGTTGRPKGVVLNYRHLNGSPEAMKYFVDLNQKDVKISSLPLSHIAGLIYIQNCIIFGISLVLMERFSPLEFLKNIQNYRVTCFHIVPSMYLALLQVKEIENFDLSSLRWIVVFGAPSSPEILKKFHQYCPNAHFLNGWGLTETCPPNTVIPLGCNRIESVGKPAPWYEIKIFEENDKEVPTGEVGEVVIKGWIVMQGYYKDEEATAQVLRDGWFHTGDLGRFDNEGFLYIVGRKKEMIKVSGQIVYAPEVEAALYKNTAIVEAAVIGIPDKMRGELVKAFVVLKPGQLLKEEDLRYFCREHLAHFKVPHEVEFRENLPKNRAGKIDKEVLKNS